MPSLINCIESIGIYSGYSLYFFYTKREVESTVIAAFRELETCPRDDWRNATEEHSTELSHSHCGLWGIRTEKITLTFPQNSKVEP